VVDVAKKILAYARSKSLICLGCASTGLAATNYEGFHTAHALFCYPVVEDDEKDESEPAACDFATVAGRAELIEACSIIIWDEALCNHRELYEAAHRVTEGFRGKIVIKIGDHRQILPVVKFGTPDETYLACVSSSHLWAEFTTVTLSINMRLRGMHNELARLRNLPLRSIEEQAQIADLQQQLPKQRAFADMLLAIGEGRDDRHGNANILNADPSESSFIYHMAQMRFFTPDDPVNEILQFLYPHSFNPSIMHETSILAATNDKVDEWNSVVQKLNDNVAETLTSADQLTEVDDLNGSLARMMMSQNLAVFNPTGVPPHQLILKVDDICIVTRNLSKRCGLATNARVRILRISPFCIRVQTVGDNPLIASIPRIRFRARLHYVSSYEMTRIQFPLRLAYAMTFNKSQGQTLHRILLDTTYPPFCHGHLYVAMSRVTNYANIRLFCNAADLDDGIPNVRNIVFSKVVRSVARDN
jgi:ATP-dependent DNA helicase PIF1